MNSDHPDRGLRVRPSPNSPRGLRQRVEKLQKEVIFDPVCKELYSRSFLETQLDALANNRNLQRLTVLMLDYDGFKRINDTFGHLHGDSVLREIGIIIANNIRNPGFGARFGGDEYAIILPDIESDNVEAIISRLQFLFNEANLQLTIGQSSSTKLDGQPIDPRATLKQADDNLLEIKQSKKSVI